MHIFLVLLLGLSTLISESAPIIVGADQSEKYLGLLKSKNVAIVVNQTSVVNNTHLVDFLISKNVNLKLIFAPEHGFRGEIEAGDKVADTIDIKTKIPVISLYGKTKKPTEEHLKQIDIVIYDIQDVGCRFFTYISTLHYVMEACAENNISLLILDRPNPNGDYVDGPILKKEFSSFVGVDPIPVVYGCTPGELAMMINGEGWLKNKVKCKLEIIKVENYSHKFIYSPPIKPSPNLPNYLSIRLYPSLCFFEATNISIGRGTPFPFQVIGYPDSACGSFRFKPLPRKGFALNPLHNGKDCFGIDLRTLNKAPQFTLTYFIDFYEHFNKKADFWQSERWFNLLAGNSFVIDMIKKSVPESEISKSWKSEVDQYKVMRKKYLLYPDFE